MNFLAHLYFSGEDKDLMIGNFIGDYVKGRAYLNFKPEIQQGILLHRKIDELTDNHKITKEFSKLFKSHYQKYSGIVVDIFYDHFLSKNWHHFSDENLKSYIKKCHRVLLKNISLLPLRVQTFVPIMIAQNRLHSYSKIEGLKTALDKMAQYTSLPSASDFAIETLQNNYEYIDEHFIIFFNDMINQVEEELSIIAMKYSN